MALNDKAISRYGNGFRLEAGEAVFAAADPAYEGGGVSTFVEIETNFGKNTGSIFSIIATTKGTNGSQGDSYSSDGVVSQTGTVTLWRANTEGDSPNPSSEETTAFYTIVGP